MSIFSQLFPSTEAQEPEEQPESSGNLSKSEKVQARYAEVFAKPTGTTEGAEAMKVSHVGCLNQIYRYEKHGWIRRAGADIHHGRAILWIWIRGRSREDLSNWLKPSDLDEIFNKQ